MSTDQDSPKLPLELEHQIFTQALREEVADAKNLCLVAKRVFDWLIPIYYDVVVSPENFAPGRLRIQRYGHHVHHFHTSQSRLVDLLTYCPNVYNLGIWTIVHDRDVETILKLPVTRLSIGIQSFLERTPNFATFCSRITHLDISSRELWDPKDLLPQFPVLTHIASFPDVDTDSASWEDGKMLKVIVVIMEERDVFDGQLYAGEMEEGDDLRVVRMSFGCAYGRDWENGARGGKDMWAFADEVIAERFKEISYDQNAR
ncbi:hypothetical protein BDN72DRAFT_435443 [Pluteus cervinus]|uniref:Uncharacterized protein n=1 Tax=Pluteus cervinus TaxID=181527 RepID=A0ACD3A9U4_9AGAR|nr:hypothetical protein BDN72DRAFT_435443 [Pluteus cervinus]